MKLTYKVDASSRAGDPVMLKPSVGHIVWFTMSQVCIQWSPEHRSTHAIEDVIRCNPICEETGTVFKVVK